MSINKRDIAIISINILLLLIITLMVIKHFAPGLLGYSQDLILVQESEEVVPFYENIFAFNESENYLIADPRTVVRAKPLVRRYDNAGPNDLLGFRNLSIPNSADVVFIGDSQTYGNNAPIEWTIPSITERVLRGSSDTRVYSMATGGWGGLQYYYIAEKSLAFGPEVLVVCFYSGNDPLESFALAYGDEQWLDFRPGADLQASDMPATPEEEMWGAVFENGNRTVFTPDRRYISVSDNSVADAGWQILEMVASRIASIGIENDVQILFTIIPTKELVYAQKLEAENFDPPANYRQLIAAELQRIKVFEEYLRTLQKAHYVPVWETLQQAALLDEPLYPSNLDGHPVAHGYSVVADALAPTLIELLSGS